MTDYSENRPRKGDSILYRGALVGFVSSVEGNLCWVQGFGNEAAQPFIWRFRDGLNVLHGWPTKEAPHE